MKRKTKVFFASFSLIAMSIFCLNIKAYELIDCHVKDITFIPVQFANPPDGMQFYWGKAINNWNNKNVGYTLLVSSTNTLGSWYDENKNLFGRTRLYTYEISQEVAYFQSYVNSNGNHMSDGIWTESTTTHELGHPLGLGDREDFSPVLMSHGRDRSIIKTPQDDDMNGLRQKYFIP